jgi:hypothetical protein
MCKYITICKICKVEMSNWGLPDSKTIQFRYDVCELCKKKLEDNEEKEERKEKD